VKTLNTRDNPGYGKKQTGERTTEEKSWFKCFGRTRVLKRQKKKKKKQEEKRKELCSKKKEGSHLHTTRGH